MKGNLARGAGYFLQGLGLIWKPGIRSLTLWPILVTLLVFAGLIWAGASYFDTLLNQFLPGGESWWAEGLRYILWPLFALALLLVWYFSFTIIANLIGSPFNGFLAEKVEQHLRGEKIEDLTAASFLREIIPSLLNEVVKISYFLLLAVPLLILFMIPVINLAAPFLWGLFMVWMLALEYTEYPMDNHGLRFKKVRAVVRTRRLSALGFGGMVTLCLLVPGLNLLVMPAAVAGATVFWVRELEGSA